MQLQACNVQAAATRLQLATAREFSRPRTSETTLPSCAQAELRRHTHARMHAPAGRCRCRCLVSIGLVGGVVLALLPPRESVTRERVAVHACTHWQVAVAVRDEWRSAGAGAGRGAMRFGQVRVAVGRAQPRRSLCSPRGLALPATVNRRACPTPRPRPRPRASEVDRRRDSGSVRAQSSIYLYYSIRQ